VFYRTQGGRKILIQKPTLYTLLNMKKAAVFKLAKGYFGRNKNVWTIARQKVHKGLQYSYRDRKAKKRSMHELWVTQINAATRQHGMVYSQFITGLVKEDVALNRKMLAELAVTEPYSFYALVSHVKERKLALNINT
jgi:large subunit ribosomal protein L20